jgi:WD40 repeat protein
VFRTYVRPILVLLLLSSAAVLLPAQSVTPFAIRFGPPAEGSARVMVRDAAGRPLRPSAADIEVWENGVPVRDLTADCPTSQTPRVASVVLSVDISGSMSRDIPPEVMALARTFGQAFVKTVAMPPSTMALQTCDEFPQVLVDFTSSSQRLLDAVAAIRARGGNNFVNHLLDPNDGALTVAARGTKERSVVLVTDAFWQAMTPDEVDRAVAVCQANAIRFFAVVLTERSLSQTGIVSSFRTLAERTGGAVFEGVTTDDVAASIAKTVAGSVDGIMPCDLRWTTIPVCPKDSVRRLTFGVRGVDTVFVDLPAATLTQRSVRVEPPTVRFTTLPAGSEATSTIRVTAVNAPVNVTNVLTNDPAFRVAPSSFALATGGSIDLTVTYAGDGRMSVGTRFTFVEDACSWDMPVVRVTRAVSPGADGIVVVEPNGREEILAGSDTVITWSAADTLQPVQVELSLDGGATWDTIARDVIGTRHRWQPVPLVESTTCLVRVRTKRRAVLDSLYAFPFDTRAIDVAPDLRNEQWHGSLAIGTVHGYVARSERGHLSITRVWQVHADTITDVVHDPQDPARLLTGSVDGTMTLVEGTSVSKLFAHGAAVRSVQFDPSSTRGLSGGDDGRIVEYDLVSGAQTRVVASLPSAIHAMRFAGPDTLIVVTVDSNIRALRVSTGTDLWRRSFPSYPVISIDVHPTHHLIAAGSVNGRVLTIDPATGAERTPPVQLSSNFAITDVAFGNDNPSAPMVYAILAWGEAYSVLPSLNAATALTYKSRPARCVARHDGTTVIGWNGMFTTSYASPNPLSAACSRDVDRIRLGALNDAASTLIMVSEGGLVWTWDVVARRPTRVFRAAEPDTLVRPVLSGDGRSLLIASSDGTVTWYDMQDPSAAGASIQIVGGISSMRFDPRDASRAGVGTALGITVIAVPSMAQGVTYPSFAGPVVDFSWSPDGSKIAVLETGPTGTCSSYIIDTFTGVAGAAADLAPLGVDGYGTLAWDPTGEFFFAAGSPTVDRIDSANVRRARGFVAEPIREISVSSDGRLVVGVAASATVPLVNIDPTALSTTSMLNTLIPSYDPTDGRFAGGPAYHVTGSMFGAAIVRPFIDASAADPSDVSDTLFSIVWPRVSVMAVDMGRVRVGARRDSTVVDLVRNRTRFPIRADSVRIVGPNAADFLIAIENVVGLFAPGSTSRGEVAFLPTAAGPRTATCLLFTGRDTARIELSGEGVVPALSHRTRRIDLGTHIIGSVVDSTTTVFTCVAPGPTRITRVCLVDAPSLPFAVLDPAPALCVAPFTIAPADSIVLTLRFTPVRIGRVTTLLEVETDDGLGPYIVTVTGAGIGPTIAVRSDSGFPGDRVPIVLEMRGTNGAGQGGAALAYEADLRFDRSVLVPDALATNADGTVRIAGAWDAMDTVVARVPARITLGRADSTIITVTRFVWFDDQGVPLDRDVGLESGVFTVRGICDENGQRLFNPDGVASAPRFTIRTGASGVTVHVRAATPEPITVEIVDLVGRTVASETTRATSEGTDVIIDLSAVARGMYVVRVVTSDRASSAIMPW